MKPNTLNSLSWWVSSLSLSTEVENSFSMLVLLQQVGAASRIKIVKVMSRWWKSHKLIKSHEKFKHQQRRLQR